MASCDLFATSRALTHRETKVRSSYGPLAYFSDIFRTKKATFLPEMKTSEKYVSGPQFKRTLPGITGSSFIILQYSMNLRKGPNDP